MEFQSLLYWNTSENTVFIKMVGFDLQFQSLLYWNTSENEDSARIGFVDWMFQSLLCWNTSENFLNSLVSQPLPYGFNPCCVGIPLRISRRNNRRTGLLMFQSLLCWNTSENRSPASFARALSRCFNPCCVGIPLRITSPAAFVSLILRFNPCCVGIPLRIFIIHLCPIRAWALFQSLLCWNTSENWKQPNPSHRQYLSVSILVVLEYL